MVDITSLFQVFLTIFISTITNVEIIWVTYPVYITWFAMEFLVERKEIRYSHSLANSIIFSWVSIDWLRHLYLHNEFNDYNKLIITLFFLFLSLFILISSIKRKKIAKILGRTRSFAYFQIMLTPFIYGTIEFNYIEFLSIIFFFPLIYIALYLIVKLLPEFTEEEEEEKFEEEYEENNVDNFAENNLQYNQQNYSNYYNYYGYNYENYYGNYYRYRR